METRAETGVSPGDGSVGRLFFSGQYCADVFCEVWAVYIGFAGSEQRL